MTANDVHNPPGFAPVSQNINTTVQLQVLNGNSLQPIAGATFAWTPLASYSGLDQPPSWFMGSISPNYHTDANGMIIISGSTSLPNHNSTTFDHSMAYNWTCSATGFQNASGTQEFPPSSWRGTESQRSPESSFDLWTGTLNQQILLYP